MINEKISKNYLKVLTALISKKFRQKYQLFIVEGDKIVLELIEHSPSVIKHLVIRENHVIPSHITDKFDIYFVDDTQAKKISSMASPPPVMAVCIMSEYNKLTFRNDYPFELYLDDVRDPGNIGTILRTAEWFGIQKVFLSEGSVDLFHPRLIQASMGSFFRMDCSVLPHDKLKTLQKPLIGAVLEGTSLVKWKQPVSGTMIVGNESNGISPHLLEMLDDKIKIEAAPGNSAESLNVAIATGIILYSLKQKIQNK